MVFFIEVVRLVFGFIMIIEKVKVRSRRSLLLKKECLNVKFIFKLKLYLVIVKNGRGMYFRVFFKILIILFFMIVEL